MKDIVLQTATSALVSSSPTQDVSPLPPDFVILLKIDQVVACTGVPKSSIYRKIAKDEFPKPVRLGKKSVAWRSDEIRDWINSRKTA